MFEDKRARGWLLLAGAAALAVAAGAYTYLGGRAIDDEVRAFERRAEQAYDDDAFDRLAELYQDGLTLTEAEEARLDEFLSLPGVTPYLFDGDDNFYRARYKVESWGFERRVVITWSPDGTTIRSD